MELATLAELGVRRADDPNATFAGSLDIVDFVCVVALDFTLGLKGCFAGVAL